MEFEWEPFKSQTWVSVVVKLKANKCYQELLYSLSSYINLLNLLNLQGFGSVLGSWPLAGFRPLAPDPDLWPTPTLKGVLVLVLVFDQSFGQLSG